MHRLFVRLAMALLSVAATHVVAQDVPIYTDGLLNNFLDYSYNGGSDFNYLTPPFYHNTAPSIAFTGSGNPFNAVSFAHPSATYASGSYSGLRFFVHGGGTGGQQISLMLQTNSNVNSVPVLNASVSLDGYIAGGSIPANAWAQVDVPFSSLAFNNDGSFDRIDIQTGTGAQPVLYIDDVSLVGPASAATGNYIFGDSFEPEYMFVPQWANNSIRVYQRTTNTTSGFFVREAPLGAGIKPNAVTFAPDGGLWVVDDGNFKLLRYTLQSFIDPNDPNFANPPATRQIGPVGNSSDIFDLKFFGGFGYVSQSNFGGTNQILKFTLSDLNAGNNVSTSLTNANLSVPAGLAFDAQGRLWISNYGGALYDGKLVRMNVATGTVDKVGTSVMLTSRHSLSQSEGVAFDEYDSLWVGNNGEPTISVYTDAQLNNAAFGATAPSYQIDVGAGGAAGAGYVGGIAMDRRGDLRANYEYALSVLGYTFTAAPYAITPLTTIDNATTNPGRGGIAIWPVPSTVHR